MTVSFDKKNNCCLINNTIILDVEDGLTINKLKNLNSNSFSFDNDTKMWVYNNYKSCTQLINLLYPEKKIVSIDFKNKNTNDYRKNNVEIKFDERFTDTFTIPKNYQVLKIGTSYKVLEGKFAGQYRNMYWKVKDSNDETYYLMHIKDEIFTKISKRDINKVLDYNGIRPSWYLNSNGYVGTTIRINNSVIQMYLHQLILDVHNEDLTSFEKTVDHINRDKLDNRRQNIRLVDMSIQNTNREKSSRRKDACELPDGLQQKDIPKYVVYRKEFMDEEKIKFREYFYICNHPNFEQRWDTTKSSDVSIQDKLKQAKLKLQLIENKISQENYDKELGNNKKLDFPKGIRLATTSIPYKLIFDLRQNGNRYGLNYVLKSDDLQNELDKFIELINEKYTDLKMSRHLITNPIIIHKEEISEQKQNNNIKFVLPPNFSFYFDSKSNFYYLSFNKVEKGIKQALSKKILSNNIQNEFDIFMIELNKKYENIKPIKFTINNTENIKLYNNEEEIKNQTKKQNSIKSNIQINNLNINKSEVTIDETGEFKLPTNISVIKNTLGEYYLQFVKSIDGKRVKKMAKLTTNDFQTEYNNFIDTVNNLYKDIVQFKKSTLCNIPKEYMEIVKPSTTEQVDNTGKAKPVMPQNFSICSVNQIDYIQFNKTIDEKRYQYKTKINSYDLDKELDQFIDQLNEKYDLGLIKSHYKIINTNGWKTTNKIVEHVDTDEKIANREKAKKHLEKKKQELGETQFKKARAQYAKQYRANKANEIEV